MKKKQIYWLANSNSPHVRHWCELLEKTDCGYDIQIISIWHKNSIEDIKLREAKCIQILPRFFSVFPEILQYFFLGIIIRFGAINKAHAFHVHGTSGYGLAALISGFKFGVTTYGSEIYSAPNKGLVYKLLINQILKSSVAITSASPEMTKSLQRVFKVRNEKIHEFSLGVSDVFYFNNEECKSVRDDLGVKEGPVWIANRRVAPNYHTLELAQAFVRFRKKTNKGFLLIMEGDSDRRYLSEVELFCETCDYVRIIRGFVSQDRLRAFLSAADFAISIPDTDQLSSSILEGGLCDAVPLLRKLPSYDMVKRFSILFEINNGKQESFDEIFIKSSLVYQTAEYVSWVEKVHGDVKKFKMEYVFPNILNYYKDLVPDLFEKNE